MKPNGKRFVTRAVLFVVCAVGLLSSLAGAETVHGSFKLPVEARWGTMVLPPGEYEFVVDTDSLTRMITVRSKDSGWSRMVMTESVSDVGSATGASLTLAKSDEGMYV